MFVSTKYNTSVQFWIMIKNSEILLQKCTPYWTSCKAMSNYFWFRYCKNVHFSLHLLVHKFVLAFFMYVEKWHVSISNENDITRYFPCFSASLPGSLTHYLPQKCRIHIGQTWRTVYVFFHWTWYQVSLGWRCCAYYGSTFVQVYHFKMQIFYNFLASCEWPGMYSRIWQMKYILFTNSCLFLWHCTQRRG